MEIKKKEKKEEKKVEEKNKQPDVIRVIPTQSILPQNNS